MDAPVDMEGIICNAFEDTDVISLVEEWIWGEVLSAFTAGDAMHEECSTDSVNSNLPTYEDGVDNRDEEMHTSKGTEESNFDASALEEAITVFYEGARCTKLATTILLHNICTIHRVNNSFTDEMFTILHAYILPKKNY